MVYNNAENALAVACLRTRSRVRHDLIAMVDLIEDRKEELARVCPRFGVLSLGLFGSATREDFHAEASDLDFVVEFAPMSPDEHARSYFGLLKELEHLCSNAKSIWSRCPPFAILTFGAISNPRRYRSMQRDQRAYLWDG